VLWWHSSTRLRDLTTAPEIADTQRRFAALDRLYGVAGGNRIRDAHVAVIGIGGVGSWAAEALARSGVGRLTLIDLDHVSESNINRQVHAITQTVGQSKVKAMQERIATINPECQVNCVDEFVSPQNWPALLAGDVNAVVDACDQMSAKTTLAACSFHSSVDFITVGAAGGKRLAHKVDVDDLSQCTHDPLLAQLRYQLRKHHRAARDGKKIGIACVFSRESVAAPAPSCAVENDNSLNCHGYGSVVSVTAAFGFCAAGWVIEKIGTRVRRESENNVII
jgi:tRNA threonylcarbamoyladenosine dehydratase